ncbi:unnamed protein product [Arctia plantaginis]|uniref:Coiled-coil-helix-coiled-coil-helix domain-containing protein 7 n=1 Tax=Arctia plantaginis TaxID=874455 RepID=A0A8S0ZBH7_ARCPL|nr:unnamed protein product [Arctia plantaginis]
MTKQVNKDAERLNPCLKEQEQSYACLSKNNYDQSKCEKFFDNYNICKKFWGKVYTDRKTKGLYPYMPHIEDREKIKQQYFDNVKNH